MWLFNGDTASTTTMPVTSNTIFNVGGPGIWLAEVPAAMVVKSNIITQAQVGIELDCSVYSNVTSNTLSAIHSVGLADVSGSIPVNYYYNTPTLYSGGCP